MNAVNINNESDLLSSIGTSNTIFRIQSNIDIIIFNNLAGKSASSSLIVPNCSIFQFCGGKISNGTIQGDNTLIEALPYQIFNNITFDGTFNCECAYFEWFGAKGDGTTDDRESIQKGLDSVFYSFMLLSKTYIVNSYYVETNNNADPDYTKIRPMDQIGLSINHAIKITGQALNNNISKMSSLNCGSTHFNIFVQINSSDVELSNICIRGSVWQNSSNSNVNYVQDILATKFIEREVYNEETSTYDKVSIDDPYLNIILKRLFLDGCDGACINLHSVLSELDNVNVGSCDVGFIIRGRNDLNGSGTSTILKGCYCASCATFGFKVIAMNYVNLIGCAVDYNNGLQKVSKEIFPNYPCTLGYPYFFSYCRNLSVTTCASEVSQNIMYIENSFGINVNSHFEWHPIDKEASFEKADYNRRLYLSNCRAISFNQSTMGIIRDDKSNFISIIQCRYIRFNDCLLRNTDGSESDISISSEEFSSQI